MYQLISIELYKIFNKWRTYIAFGAILVLIPVIEIAFSLQKGGLLNYISRSLGQSFIILGNIINTYFISYFILNSIAIHIPFLITLNAGDMLAGEGTSGTYRILLTRPVNRLQVVTAKFISSLIYTALLVLFLGVISLGLGYFLFGTGELLVTSAQGFVILEKTDILWRFIFAYGYSALCMFVVSALAFLLSGLVENSIGPIISTMAVIIGFFILSNIDIDFFRMLKPYLFTNYFLNYQEFFNSPLDIGKITNSTLVMAGHVVGLYAISSYIFIKKDILS